MNQRSAYKMGQDFKIELTSTLLSFLFGYSSISKLIDWYVTKSGLYNQVFPIWMADFLLYFLPAIEIMVAVFLLIPDYRLIGVKIAVILMLIFSTYIGLVLTGIFGRIPCSCGGVLNNIGWWEHLLFNLFFLGLGIWGLWEGRFWKR